MAVLPRPKVSVITASDGEKSGRHEIAVSVERDGKGICHSGAGPSVNDAVADVVGKILGDRRTAEWLP